MSMLYFPIDCTFEVAGTENDLESWQVSGRRGIISWHHIWDSPRAGTRALFRCAVKLNYWDGIVHLDCQLHNEYGSSYSGIIERSRFGIKPRRFSRGGLHVDPREKQSQQ
ncbi:hypothetical protein CBL_07270 [Carabus blaptoides fortunei]